jgi:hypothetical protein
VTLRCAHWNELGAEYTLEAGARKVGRILLLRDGHWISVRFITSLVDYVDVFLEEALGSIFWGLPVENRLEEVLVFQVERESEGMELSLAEAGRVGR